MMKYYKNLSFRAKIIFVVMSISIITTIIVVITGLKSEISVYENALIEKTTAHADLISQYCVMPLEFNYPAKAVEVLDKLQTIPYIYNGIVYSGDDSLFASYQKKNFEIKTYPKTLKTSGYLLEGDYIHVLRPISYEGRLYGYIYIRAFTNISDIILDNIYDKLLLIIVIFGLTFLLATMLQKVISAPILALKEFAGKFSENENFSLRIVKQSNDEVGQLYDEFNLMLDTIESRALERNQVLTALRESEERFRKLFEDSAEAILLMEDGKYFDCNRAALLMMRMEKPEDIRDISPWEISPKFQSDSQPSDEKARQMNALAFEKGSQTFEWENIRADGEHFIAEVQLTPIHFSDRKILHVVWRDITEKKRAEAELKTYREHLEEIIRKRTEEISLLSQLVYGSLESADVGAWWIDFKEEDVYHALDTTVKMIGFVPNNTGNKAYRLSDWINQFHYTKTAFPEYASIIDETIEQFFGTISGKYEKYQAVYPVAFSDRSIKWINVRADIPMRDDNRKALKMTGTLIDVTKLKWAEDELRRSKEELERTNKALQIRSAELETFNKSMLGREQRIIELKEEINLLCAELNRAPVYPPVWQEGV